MQGKKLSVIQVIDQLEVGGAERVLINWANTLQQKGHVSAIVVTVQPGSLYKEIHANVRLFDLQRKSKWDLLAMKRLVGILKQYDIIHIHSSHNLRFAWLAKKLFGLHKTLFFHEHFLYEKMAWHQRWIYPQTKMICTSRQVLQWAVQQHLAIPGNIFLLPNTILPQKPAKVHGGKKNNVIQLLVVANIYEQKNIGFAIDLLQTLHHHDAGKYELTIIGKVVDENYYHSIREKILEKNLQHLVHFIHDCNNVQAFLYHYDIALHPSKKETGPLVLIEYLAHGIPFLTYLAGEVPMQIQQDLPEFIIENFEQKNWLEAFNFIMLQNKLNLQIRMQQAFEKYFLMDAYYAQCMQIYQKGLPDS